MKKHAPWPVVWTLVVALLGCETEVKPAKGTNSGGATGSQAGGTSATSDHPGGPATRSQKETRPPIPKSEMRTPWAKAHVGDWILQKSQLPSGKTVTKRYEITKVTDTQVTMAIKKPEAATADREVEIDLMDENDRYVDPLVLDFATVSDATLEIAGKKIPCKLVVREFGEDKTETWYAFDIPLLDGVLKSIRNGELMQEVLDFHVKTP